MATSSSHLPPLWNIFLFGFSISILFFAFIPSQAFSTVTFGTFGAFGVILLYFCFCLSNMTAPYVVKHLGITFSMTLGAIGYIPFVLAISLRNETLFIVGSITCGAGAALLWVGIGVSVTLLSDENTRGRRFGLFSFVNRLNFMGSLTVGILFSTGSTRSDVFLYLTIILSLSCVVIGMFGFLVLVPLERKKLETIAEKGEPANSIMTTKDDARTDCASILRVFTDSKFIPFLCTNFLVCGFLKGWVFAVLTTWSPDLAAVGYMMSMYGALVVSSAPFHGWLFDYLPTLRSRTCILFVSIAAGCLGVISAFHYKLVASNIDYNDYNNNTIGNSNSNSNNNQTSTGTKNNTKNIGFWLSVFFFGIMAGGGEAVINAGCSWLYPRTASRAFAAKLLSECFGQVCGYCVIPVLGTNYVGQLILLSGLIFLDFCICMWGILRTGENENENVIANANETENKKETKTGGIVVVLA